MKTRKVDLTIIGGGPAGLAAAHKAKECGIQSVVLLERDIELGGILNQCIHDGFGLLRFKKQLSGAQYAQIFVDQVRESGVEILTGAMVTELTPDKKVYVTQMAEGTLCLDSKTVILAMGCRERTRNQVRILGTRPAGVLTAGAVQKYINISGYLPGQKAVILGSGDIGLIMARRMTLEGIEVTGVYEVMPTPGGLRRNIVQCLDDYGIPLHLSHTVQQIHGKKRVEAVTVVQVDENRKPIPGTERVIECDLLVLSVGLIPENELSRNAGIQLHPKTSGPIVDNAMMTSIPGIFAAGNVSAVFDLVDYVSMTGEKAAEGAAAYLKDPACAGTCIPVLPGDNVSFVFPQNLRCADPAGNLYLRVSKEMKNVRLTVKEVDRVLLEEKHRVAAPPEMVCVPLRADKITQPLTVSVQEG